MRWVLPGDARLERDDRDGDELQVVCRPLDAVLERTTLLTGNDSLLPVRIATHETDTLEFKSKDPDSSGTVTNGCSNTVGASGVTVSGAKVIEIPRQNLFKRLATVKILLEVLAVLVTLISGILALFGVSRK